MDTYYYSSNFELAPRCYTWAYNAVIQQVVPPELSDHHEMRSACTNSRQMCPRVRLGVGVGVRVRVRVRAN